MFKNWYFLIGLILTLSLLWPLFWAPYFSHQDDVQTIRLYEMAQCIKDRQIPCRWVPDLGGGYGYPLFNYYGPLPYYIGEVFYLSSGNLLFSAKMMFALSLISSFVFMYLLGRKLWGEQGGSLAAVFYAFAPYHALDMYVRGAMGELWALMFFPAIFWAFLRLKEKPNLASALLLGLFMALLITAHNLSAMIFLPLVILSTILILAIQRRVEFIIFSLMAFIVAAVLSAFYLLPVTFERDLVHLETTTEGYFSYTEHFKGLKKLFVERTWEYGNSNREIPNGPRDSLSYQIGWVHLLGWILALVTAIKLWGKRRDLSLIILITGGVITFSIFMIHPRSEFVWKLVDSLKYIQFPWRFLILVTFSISLLGGSFFLVLKDNRQRKWFWSLFVLLVVLLNFAYFTPEKFLYITDGDLLNGSRFDHYKMYAIFDYLPKAAQAPPANPAPAPYQIITGDSEVKNFAKGSQWMKFETTTKSHTILRLSQYYFPDWKIKVDGDYIKIDYKNYLGLMTLLLGEGNHSVEASLHDTPVRTFGNFVSGIGIIVFIVLSLLSFQGSRKRLMYYLKAFNR